MSPLDQHTTVAVIGAGAMGAGIAQVAASAGHPVALVDVVPGAAEQAVARIIGGLQRQEAKGRISSAQLEEIVERISPAETVSGLPAAGLVVEAVREDLAVKQALFRQLAQTQASDTVLATNTSSLDITAIADGIPEPGRIIGLHFFNPPPAMRLVEVVAGERSDEAVLAAAAELMRAWGKTPVRCTSTPGFIVNRVARPFYGEAQRMLMEGVADAATLDAALRTAGFRMGPLELTDLIGQDVNLAVGTSVWEQTGRDPRYEPTALQQELVSSGRLGRKTGQGLYRYDSSGKALDARPDEARVAELLAGPVETNPVARTVAMLVNEAVDLVRRGEATAEDVDTAMTLGTNYPKGPIAWGQEIGYAVVADQLAALDRAFPGGRYRPSPALGGGAGTGADTGAAAGTDAAGGTGAVGGSGASGATGASGDLTHVNRMWADDEASRRLGMDATTIEVDHAVVRMPVTESMVNGHAIAHGGYIFTLADSAFALACNSRGQTTVAAGADVTFVRTARLGDVLLADAQVRTAYGRSGLTDVRVTRESDGAVIAEFRGRSRSIDQR